MTITIHKKSEYTTTTHIAVYIGDHTMADHTIYEYAENAIKNLYEEVKMLAKGLKGTTHPNLVISRSLTKDDIYSLNFKLQTEYKRHVEEFKNIVENLPFLKEEQVTLSQMDAFCSIANLYGRHSSNTYAKYRDIRETVARLEKVKRELQSDNEGMVRVVI